MHYYKKNKETINNLVWRTLQVVGRQGVSFVILLISAKLLIPEEFGIYAYLVSIIMLLLLFCDFGTSTTMSKYTTEYHIKSKNINSLISNALVIVLSLSTLMILVTLSIFFLDIVEHKILLIYAIPVLFLAPAASIYDGAYRGLKKFRELSIKSLVSGLISLIASYYLISNYGLTGAIIGINIQSLINLILLSISFGRVKFDIDKNTLHAIFSYSVLIGIANLGYYLYTKVDLLMLGYFDFIIEVGIYTLINNIIGIAILFFSIMGQVVAPNKIKLKIDKQIHVIKAEIRRAYVLLPILGLLISLLLLVIIPPLINTFFNEYSSIAFYTIFYLSLLTIPLAVLEAYLANGYITPLGYASLLSKTIILGAILNIVLNLILINIYGYIGVVISTVIVHTAINILKLYLLNKELNSVISSKQNHSPEF